MFAMPPAKAFDIDAELGLDIDQGPTHTTKIKLFGREWTMVCDVNTFSLGAIASGDLGAIIGLFRTMVAEDEWSDFGAAMAKVRNLDAEKLMGILNAMIEVAAERPTTPPSGSSVTPTKRTSSPRSGGGTSATRVVTSRR